MKLYHVQAEDDNGENQDRFVVAENPAYAIELWIEDFTDAPEGDEKGLVSRVRMILPDVAGSRFTGPARVVAWDDLPVEYEAAA